MAGWAEECEESEVEEVDPVVDPELENAKLGDNPETLQTMPKHVQNRGCGTHSRGEGADPKPTCCWWPAASVACRPDSSPNAYCMHIA